MAMKRWMERLVERASGGRWFMTVGPKVAPLIDRTVHQLTRGRIIPSARYRPTLFLTAIGRRSGQPRTVPLLYMPDGDRFVVVASNFGRPSHPAWSYNLLANPMATVQLPGRRTVTVQARIAEGEERNTLWKRVVTYSPNYAVYGARAEREINLFVLEPTR